MRFGLVALLALASPHWMSPTQALAQAAPRNPELVVPPPAPATAPLPVSGQVVRADTALSLPGARVTLWHGGRVIQTQITGQDGAFRFDSVPRGHVVIQSRMITYAQRFDSLVVADSPAVRLTIPLRPQSLHLGHGPPDPRVVTAARAQRGRWVCDREQESIEQARTKWLRFLRIPQVRRDLRLDSDSSHDAAHLHFVRDDAECRRVADAYDREGLGVTSLAFTVFSYGRLRFISEPYGGDGAVLDEKMRYVSGILLE